ncbi:MAG: glycosyltransferase family 2 protein [Parcubacteria group bacterium]|jgi:hypothetical protein
MDERHFFVVVNYNSGDSIIRCLHSILQSQHVHPLIVVVDNASSDQSLELCKLKYPNLIYIYNTQNVGFATAANIGTRYALERNATTITYCNPDATLSKDCASLLTTAVTDNIVAIASPLIFDTTRKKQWFSGGKINFFTCQNTHAEPIKDLTQKVVSSEYISGCVMTVHASVYKKIGLFDERFFLYYEDADFCLRAKKEGFSLGLLPHAKAFHDEVSENHKEIKTYFLVLSGLLFFDKHAHGLARIWFHIHFFLRKIKNYYAQKKFHPYASSVHKAFVDYESLT